jgi:hypothetical protein
MNKNISKTLVVASLLGSLSSLNAGVSFLVDGEVLSDANGAPIGQNSLVVLLASTTNSTFEPLAFGESLAVGSLWGDDMVLWKGDISSFGVDGVLNAATGNLNFTGNWGQNDAISLLWFPTLTTSNDALVGGASYGLYTNSSAIDGSGAWITPADGSSNYNLLFYTTNGEQLAAGSNSPSSGRATLTVTGAAIPEPSSFAALAGFAVLGLAASRRRRA